MDTNLSTIVAVLDTKYSVVLLGILPDTSSFDALGSVEGV